MVLVRFSKREHLNSFRENGHIYMNPYSLFGKAEIDVVRKDEYENLTYLLQSSQAKIKVNECELKTKGSIKLYFPNDDKANVTHIFSMSSLEVGDNIPDDGSVFDERIREFGDSFVVILDVKAFLNRVELTLENLKGNEIISSYKADKIVYVDESRYQGKMTIFHKLLRYAWQREWRIAVSAKNNEVPLQFNIGSIKDISVVIDMKKFQNTWIVENGKQIINFSEAS